MPEVNITNRIVLIAESAAEKLLVEEIERLSFTAFWSVNCTGRASRAIVSNVFDQSSHIRIEALGPRFLVEQLLQFVKDELSRFSIVCISDLVDVRGDVLKSY